jgi:hypothetical protein
MGFYWNRRLGTWDAFGFSTIAQGMEIQQDTEDSAQQRLKRLSGFRMWCAAPPGKGSRVVERMTRRPEIGNLHKRRLANYRPS